LKGIIVNFEQLKDALPEYAKDLKLNLGSLANETALTSVQRAGTFIASAYAVGHPGVIDATLSEFAPTLSESELRAAKTAAALMSMNNVYYRFVHLVSNDEYGKLPAKLRMNALSNPGAEKVSFELWSIAVSAINGCGMCIDAHEAVVRQHGVSVELVQAVVRIAAVVAAVSAVLRAEAGAATAEPISLRQAA
jgi:alkyl hydroperoxide reductase subunit D